MNLYIAINIAIVAIKLSNYTILAIKIQIQEVVWVGRRVLFVRIDEGLYKLVRRLALEKFGYSKGSLTAAVEEAIENWVKAHSTAHTQIRANNFVGIVGRRFKKLLREILDVVGEDHPDSEVEMPVAFVRKLIMRRIGVRDPRTVSRYLRMLYEEYIAEPNGRNIIIYLDQLKEVLS